MAIAEKTKRLLLARSGGFCGNPNCNTDLFPLFENREITNVEELAHIIAQSEDGPRGDDELPVEERDDYDNIILLCPTCHSLIDKHPEQYRVEVVLDWKENHEKQIVECFEVPKFETRQKASEEVEKLQIENKVIFDTYGPNSELATENQLEAEKMWELKAIHKIIPNNRRINAIISRNYDLLTDGEKYLFEEWKIHKDGFEYNKLSGDKNSSVTFYPDAFKNILKDG